MIVLKDKKDIPQALENGAFALVVDEDIEITDNEVAWIKVASIKESITKFIRFQFSIYY
mgnify:CR=1 FL=1